MLYYLLKIIISALLIVAISEIAKRHSGFAALLASLPMTSLLAFIWLRMEATPTAQIAALSGQIFWLVLPSLVLFLAFAFLLKHGVNFWLSLVLAIALTACAYLLLIAVLKRYGITL
ncbi:MAG: DUF3147 family protein [Sideroxydans sp.]|nr:DUF3147 family protein [Sideroxydans sp.]